MAPSAPITFPPPLPSPGFESGDRLVDQSNGHSLGSTQKLPGKSNLKHTPAIPSTSHTGNGASTLEDRNGRCGESEDGVGERERGHSEGERGTRVQWVDNYGKELTQVFEFEPSSDSDDSDDSDDEDSSQACTCVIQ